MELDLGTYQDGCAVLSTEWGQGYCCIKRELYLVLPHLSLAWSTDWPSPFLTHQLVILTHILKDKLLSNFTKFKK